MKLLFIIWLCVSITLANKSEPFKATKDWQPILEDQAIPRGLHVRINLETGLKEAKLLDKTDQSQQTSSLSVLPDDGPDEKPVIALAEIKEAIENIPSNNFNLTDEEIKQIKTKFKSYDQIREELKEGDIAIKTDSEILENLIHRYEKLCEVGQPENIFEIISILKDFEYLVHQVDNAIQFIDYGGIEKIVVPNIINQTNAELKIHSLIILGAMTQNNQKAKIATFEKNVGQNLITFLSQSKDAREISMGIYALGGLLRQFPLAQKSILNKSGFTVLFKILSGSFELKVKSKILTLISDILKDFNDISDNKDDARYQQYKLADIADALLNLGYCRDVNEFFTANKNFLMQDVDATERTIASFLNSNICFPSWSECPMFRHTLLVLKNNLDTRLDEAKDDDEKEYFKEIHSNIESIVRLLYNNDSTEQKDEL